MSWDSLAGKTDDSFRNELEEATRKFSRQGINEELWVSFRERIFYHKSEFGDLEGYERLAQRLNALDSARNTRGNRLFYLSVAPSEFGGILEKLAAVGLNNPAEGSWTRVIVEKPFGTDLPSAQTLNSVVNHVFREEDTYRIDHYLGKETAQNIMVLRFANAIFEPLWNHRYIDHVQITAAEPLGVEAQAPTTKAPAPCAIWCRTICSNSSASSPWNPQPTSPPTVSATRRSRSCEPSVP